ncbi:MAG TPA: exodeoxyribonuclease VII large subunit [Candidatus Marinimicrobia bacterium]|nr:exodeoxyribonuclease VII large subunit [Candidatus Neomarinimicrobiota bacterium]
MDQIYSVADLTNQIKLILENEIPDLYLQGELSEITFHNSGHWYFTLKDREAVISCLMWRNSANAVGFRPKLGEQLILYGKLSVYQPHGKYRFVARQVFRAGQGELYQRYELLKKKLEKEGLFESARKIKIPMYPRSVALITSETGAALQDMRRIFSSYAPYIQLFIVPAKVQGAGAAQSMIKALKIAENSRETELILIARGGGSIEDLWEFNDESLARTIASCKKPIISGVGHETDTTICDYVADYRASTPTGAAEYAVRGWRDAAEYLNQLEISMVQTVQNRLNHHRQFFDLLQKHYGFRRLLDIVEKRREETVRHIANMERALALRLRMSQELLRNLNLQLEAYNPQQVLKKGFVIIRNQKGQISTSAKSLIPGEKITGEFKDGRFTATLEE